MYYQFQINAIVLIILGSVLLNDDQMTGEYVYHIYIQLYFCGLNFTDIINGLGHLMIVLGTLELFANTSAVLADVKFPENKTKSAMVLYCLKSFKNLIEIVYVHQRQRKLLTFILYPLREKKYLCHKFNKHLLNILTFIFQLLGLNSLLMVLKIIVLSLCTQLVLQVMLVIGYIDLCYMLLLLLRITARTICKKDSNAPKCVVLSTENGS